MKQYLDLLQTILDKGTHKPAARPNMPGTTSLFGHQFRHNLADGFPILTTKKIYWKGVVTELIWFLRGDTNIKYLIDNDVNIWNEDAYQYYLKLLKESEYKLPIEPYSLNEFIQMVKNREEDNRVDVGPSSKCKLGDCGFQYGKVWRRWEQIIPQSKTITAFKYNEIDQIGNLINSLKNNPESRRHIVTAIDPANDNNLALYWCHTLFQFNCRPLTENERMSIFNKKIEGLCFGLIKYGNETWHQKLDEQNIPRYYLDCQLYQRSADVVLGVPFNIASYALLTHILAKICNMIPGEFIHTFGDVHIYDNHLDAVKEQLTRTPTQLPTLEVFPKHKDHHTWPDHFEKYLTERITLDDFLKSLTPYDFKLKDYNPQPSIKAELSTGLIK